MANRIQFEYKRRFDNMVKMLKSINDLEIIITPIDTNQEQKIINLSMTKEEFKMDYVDFINSKRELIEELTGWNWTEINKLSSCLLNYTDWMAQTKFVSCDDFGLIPMNGKFIPKYSEIKKYI